MLQKFSQQCFIPAEPEYEIYFKEIYEHYYSAKATDPNKSHIRSAKFWEDLHFQKHCQLQLRNNTNERFQILGGS